jgi:tetrahydromethanopterin S-methyltransferase subunit A
MTEDINSERRGYDDLWPPVRGDYQVGDPGSAVAVVSLTSPLALRGCAIFGQCKTENLGLEKIVANVISNCNIRFVIICGLESKGHLPGNTLLALHKNGIDPQGRIVGSKGAIPFIQNLPLEAISRFQEQVELIDCIGLVDAEKIEALVAHYCHLAEPYPAEPFQVIRKRAPPSPIVAGDADLTLGAGVVMDTSAWVVMEEV